MLERESQPPADLRASTFHPPTLEMLESASLTAADPARWPTRRLSVHTRPTERACFDLACSPPDMRHPYALQIRLFRRLAFAMARRRHPVRFGRGRRHRAEDDGAMVLLEPGQVRERVLARYVVAADGADTLRAPPRRAPVRRPDLSRDHRARHYRVPV